MQGLLTSGCGLRRSKRFCPSCTCAFDASLLFRYYIFSCKRNWGSSCRDSKPSRFRLPTTSSNGFCGRGIAHLPTLRALDHSSSRQVRAAGILLHPINKFQCTSHATTEAELTAEEVLEVLRQTSRANTSDGTIAGRILLSLTQQLVTTRQQAPSTRHSCAMQSSMRPRSQRFVLR